MTTGWNFPLNEGGPEIGINDAGIETFRGRPLSFLAREICQNSLDAADKKRPVPVTVKFSLEQVPKGSFPGLIDFVRTLNACLRFWKNRDDSKAPKFFTSAIDVFTKPEIPFLKISDFNTTGLLGAGKEGTDWHNLIKSIGVSEKSSGKGGSYGIGKHAPFACSLLRTTFYSTLDAEGVRAFQGVSKLVSHKSPLNGNRKAHAQGFFGINQQCMPILDQSRIPEIFKRSETGTDVIIAGFYCPDNWETEIIKTIASDFFVAVHRKKLVVRVGDINIDHNSLPSLLKEHVEVDSDSFSDQFYDCITSEESKYFNDNLNGLGEVSLHLRLHKKGQKKVAMFRQTGMLVKLKGHFRTPVRFSGVFEARGNELNEKLRAMEPPGHDDWQPDRFSDDRQEFKEAKKIISKIYGWINKKVSETVQTEHADEVDAIGISRYLPDDLDDEQTPQDNTQPNETERGEIEEIQVRRPKPENIDSEPGAPGGDENGDGGHEGGGKEENNGDGGEPPTDPGGGGQGDEGADPGAGGRRVTVRRPLPLERARAYCIDNSRGRYRLVVVPKKSGSAQISVSYVGEEGREHKSAEIESAVLTDTGAKIEIDKSGAISSIDLEKGKACLLEITLKDPLRCALGVNANAD